VIFDNFRRKCIAKLKIAKKIALPINGKSGCNLLAANAMITILVDFLYLHQFFCQKIGDFIKTEVMVFIFLTNNTSNFQNWQ
jgi:hypothetical protein